MTKILLAVLTLAAFLYAAWLVLLRRHLPDPGAAHGWRQNFLLAVSLFALFLTGSSQTPRPASNAPLAPGGWASIRAFAGEGSGGTEGVEAKGAPTFVEVVRGVWQHLNREDAERFGDAANAAAERGELRHRDADMLGVAFRRISFHKWATRDGPKVLCYSPSPLNGIRYSSAEATLKQIELLRELKEKGTIDKETAEKAHATLARELEAAHVVNSPRDYAARFSIQRFIDDYNAGRIEAGDTALASAATILALEGVALPESASPAARLQAMRGRVEARLMVGPDGNDWMDPDLNPNVNALLKESGLLDFAPLVMCYLRASTPVEARSEELNRLQAKLLDKQVEAGVLDVETAERVRGANEREDDPDFATEADIRAYQTKVRRVVRLLYKQGEVPPFFVRELEHAIALEIIAFDSGRALREDMRWHLRSVLQDPVGDAILDALVERGLIPPAQNQRLVMKRRGSEPGLSASEKEHLEGILAMIDGDAPILLDGDGEWAIHLFQIPMVERDSILKMRHVVRALRKHGVIRDDELLERFDKVLGMPMIGRLQSEPAPRTQQVPPPEAAEPHRDPTPSHFFRRAEDAGE